MSERIKIERVSVSNFLALSEAEVDLSTDGPVVIGGKNGAGKSSLFKALLAALTGKKAVPEAPVHEGADSAEIVVQADRGIVVRSVIKPDRSYRVTVENEDGFKVPRPADWLAARFGGLDPVGFLSLDARKQASVIRDAVGVDTGDLDAQRAELESERTYIGRAARDAEGAAEALPSFPDAPGEEVDTDALMQAHAAGKTITDTADEAQRDADEAQRDADEERRKVAELEAKLASAKGREANAARRAQAAVERARALDAEAAPVRERAASLHAQLTSAATVNQQVAANRRKAEAVEEAKAKRAKWQQIRDEIAALDDERNKRLAAAPFPVPGLSFDADGGLTYKGHPFSNASAAERVRVAFAVHLMSSPGPLCVIEDASLLDADSMAEIGRMADEAGVKVLLERVGDADPGAVVIEGGRVRGAGEVTA